MTTKHTPTPWRSGGYDEVLGPDYKMVAMCMCGVELDTANRNFIVRAVNHHERLVKVVHDLSDHLAMMHDWYSPTKAGESALDQAGALLAAMAALDADNA